MALGARERRQATATDAPVRQVFAADVRARLSTPLLADVAVAVAIFLLLFAAVALADSADVPLPPSNDAKISSNPADLPYYAMRSLFRMMIALVLSYAFARPDSSSVGG